jgi:5'-methylthioadenosine phosphorylase
MTLFGFGNIWYLKPQTKIESVDYAIIGGSGMYGLEFLTGPTSALIYVKGYGLVSNPVTFGRIGDKKIVFIPRHGKDHSLYPHQVPYAANIMLLKKLGVKFIISTSIAGSLNSKITPGMMVIPDQFVNFTKRDDKQTMDNSRIIHAPMGEPYCNHVRSLIANACSKLGIAFTDKATVSVIDGPRFNTKSESIIQQSIGCDIVNMTQYPEVYYARLAGICYANLAAITDYDVCIEGSLNFSKSNYGEVLKVFKENIKKQRQVLNNILFNLPEINCECAKDVLKPFFES